MDPIAIASVVASAVVAVAVIYRDIFRSWFFRPKLEITFSLERPASRLTTIEWPLGTSALSRWKGAFWPRLRFINKGRSVARKCEAILAEIRRPDGSLDERYDPVTLRWAIAPKSKGLEPLDIACDRQVDLNTFTTIEGQGFAHFATHQDPRGIPLGIEPGDYWFCIKIYGENIKTVSQGYAVHWDGEDYRRVDMIEMNNPPASLSEWPWEIIQ